MTIPSTPRQEAPVGKFALGTMVATPGAIQALAHAGQQPAELLTRHARRDWGDVPADDACLNDAAVTNGERLLSAYTLKDGTRLWVITEADRSSKCLLLPEEY